VSTLTSSRDCGGDVLFLSSLDSVRFEPVRECTLVKRLQFDSGKDCALVRIDPPIVAQDFGVADDVDLLVISSRHEGAGLFPITEFPVFVFLCLPTDAVADAAVITTEDVTVIGWGELYRTADDARSHHFG
jgi:hypothetical protein